MVEKNGKCYPKTRRPAGIGNPKEGAASGVGRMECLCNYSARSRPVNGS